MKEYPAISTIIKPNEYIKSQRQKYTIKEVLNNGMSITYLANNKDNFEVIIKQFKQKDKKFKDNQKIIFKTLRNIEKKDKNFSFLIEHLFEQFEFKNYFFEVKKKIVGENLETLLWQRNLSLKDRISIAVNIVKTIAILHKHNVIHTDLKLEQFMITKTKNNYNTVLIDFNNCIIEDKLYLPAGTNGWKSPEHIQKQKITKKSDIFTLGQIIYTLITKRQPFHTAIENNRYEEAILNKEFYEITALNQKFPKNVSDIISHCLDPDATKRPNIWKLFDTLIDTFFPKNQPYIKFKNKKLYIRLPFVYTSKKAKFFYHSNFIYDKHFKIYKKNNRFFIQNYFIPKEANGKKYFPAFLNNRSFRESELKNGDIIQIGKLKYQFFER